MDCSPPGCSVHGIFQARILEWVVIPFSRGSSWPRDRTQVSYIAGGFFTIWATREDYQITARISIQVSLVSRGQSSRWNGFVGVQSLGHVWLWDCQGWQHARFPCPSPSPGAWSNSCPLSWWHHPTISSSVIPFASCIQSFPTSGSFLMSWPFVSGGQTTGDSASTSVFPKNIQGWFPLVLNGLNSLQSKGLSKAFSNTTVQKHQFFGTQPSL